MTNFKVKNGKKFFWGPRWNFFGRRHSEFRVHALFHENCTYRLSQNYDQINKLTGQSFRILPWYDKLEGKIKPGHQKDSVRFGWRCIDGENIEILAYVYIDGLRLFKSMLSVNTSTWVHLNFNETDKYYNFQAITEEGEVAVVRFEKSSSKKGFLGLFIHRLYPYFGGKVAAPHAMDLELIYCKRFV